MIFILYKCKINICHVVSMFVIQYREVLQWLLAIPMEGLKKNAL